VRGDPSIREAGLPPGSFRNTGHEPYASRGYIRFVSTSTFERFESAIERACAGDEEWFRSLPPFPRRVNLGSVVGHRTPTLLSERDCVLAFVRFLLDAGLPWEAIHNEVSISRWIFDKPHPAATVMTGKGLRRRVDLVLVDPERLARAELPATKTDGFRFDAFLEFGYLTDYWQQPNAQIFTKDPLGGRNKVSADVEKIASHLEAGACRLGYVIVFEECDYSFEESFAEEAEASTGCRVRFIRSGSANSEDPSAPNVGSSATQRVDRDI
jgi:hypothetical protein